MLDLKELITQRDKLLKERNKVVKAWDTNNFYYYQGKIDILNEIIKKVSK